MVFSTTTPSTYRLRTLMHDPQYRVAIAWQNIAYNQPPHPSFYLGNSMSAPPAPDIHIVGDASEPAEIDTGGSIFNSNAASASIDDSGNNSVECEYSITAEWNRGFTAAIDISNNTTTNINGWAVNWEYTDGSVITGFWNTQVSGSNPYSASNLDWNATIYPGQSITFGLQGVKGSGDAHTATLHGSVCDHKY